MNWKARWPIAIMLIAGVTAAGCAAWRSGTATEPPLPQPPVTRQGPDYLGFGLWTDRQGELSMMVTEKTSTKLRTLLAQSADYGATWAPQAVVKQVADPEMHSSFPVMWVDETRIALAWRQKQRGDKTIYFTRSLDGGRTWPTEPSVIMSEGSPFPPVLLADPGDHLYLFWQEEGRTVRDLNFMASVDAGATWPVRPVRLTAHLKAKSNQVFGSSLATDRAGRVYIAWHETDKRGSGRIVFTRSADFGQSWLPEPITVRAVSGAVSEPGISAPALNVDAAGHVYLAWEESHRTGRDIYITRSDDGGTTWPHPAVRLNSVSPEVFTIAQGIRFTADRAGTLYAAWTERVGDTRKRIAFRRSTDLGDSWAPVQFLDGDAPDETFSETPHIRADQIGRVYALWQQRRPGWPEWRIVFTRSEDGGATWLREPIRLDSLPQRSTQVRLRQLQLVSDGQGTVYVAWNGDSFGKQDGFLNRSRDYGATWLSREQWLTDPSTLQLDMPSGAASPHRP